MFYMDPLFLCLIRSNQIIGMSLFRKYELTIMTINLFGRWLGDISENDTPFATCKLNSKLSVAMVCYQNKSIAVFLRDKSIELTQHRQ